MSPSAPSLVERALTPVLGAVIGALAGGIGGTLLPADNSHESRVAGFRGVIIGASLGPFVFHELQALNRKSPPGRNYWSVEVGGSFTMTNYSNSEEKADFTLGVTRHYPVGEAFELAGQAAFVTRAFLLPDQGILVSAPYMSEIRRCDIRPSTDYLDMAWLVNYSLSVKGIDLQVGAGPGSAVQLRENPPCRLYDADAADANSGDYDFIYAVDEPQSAMPFINYVLSFRAGLGRKSVGVVYKHAAAASHQIDRMEDRTRFRTFEVVLGYSFPGLRQL